MKMTSLSPVAHLLHAKLVWLLVGVYVLAAVDPGPALTIRQLSLGSIGSSPSLSAPTLLLGVLLLNAGLGTHLASLRALRESLLALLAGTIGNLLVPGVVILGTAALLAAWHDPDQVQNLLTGLALIAAMPIAGSSTAWSQNAEGDLAVSVGLVLFSTALSPLTTPALLHSASLVTTGEYAEDLERLGGQSISYFLLMVVLVPCLLGLAARWLVGERRVTHAKPALKIVNTIAVLALCYMNAAVSLPQILARPDVDLLILVLTVTVGLCAVTFGAGWALARVLGLGQAQQTALMFGLGMSNNGTGLVVATTRLPDHPLVMLPLLLYNLLQHVAAGVSDRLLMRRRRRDFTTTAQTTGENLLARHSVSSRFL